MSDKSPEWQQNQQRAKETARRRVLKRFLAGGGVVATGKMMPDDWSKPVVESVILPAHAQASPNTNGDQPGGNTVPINTTMNVFFLTKVADLPKT